MRFAGIVSWTAALAAVGGLAGVMSAAVPAYAGDCAGNPDAIGTSRTLMIDPAEYSRVGTFQYQALPLQDHEVVLTFDDGPIPPHSTRVLDVLASQCVKANFFLVGEMARNFPWAVRRIYNEGHVIGTHSEDHPLHFGEMPVEKIRWEIDKGVADVAAALGDPYKMAPFFRFPGFDRSNIAEQEVAARHLVIFSTDTVEDDWHRHITAKQVTSLALSRLEKLGKGILLLHDIHPWTADALGPMLKELKEHGFHIVQVVPTPASVDAAVAAASELTVSWTMARQDAIDGSTVVPNWPAVSPAPIPERIALLVPDANTFKTDYSFIPVVAAGKIHTAAASESEAAPSLGAVLWPNRAVPAPIDSGARLPTPNVADIGWPVTEKLRTVEKPAFIHTGVEARASHGHRQTRVAKSEDGKAKSENGKASFSFFGQHDTAQTPNKTTAPKTARVVGHGGAHRNVRAPASSGKHA